MRVAALAAALGVVTAQAPTFQAEIAPVRWSDLRYSYRAGCPVGPPDLRAVRLSYWGFDGRAHEGTLVVHRRVASDVVAVFRRLYEARFPIRRMQPVSAYRGSDDASMAADNTSAFNCRYVAGTTRWSMHAYGKAIDLNPVENPYVSGSHVSPPAGREYADRSGDAVGMIHDGDRVVKAFARRAGWEWLGDGPGPVRDYQHFSADGT